MAQKDLKLVQGHSVIHSTNMCFMHINTLGAVQGGNDKK